MSAEEERVSDPELGSIDVDPAILDADPANRNGTLTVDEFVDECRDKLGAVEIDEDGREIPTNTPDGDEAEGSDTASQPEPPKFIARRLAEELASTTPIAAAPSGKLYIYRGGAYKPEGERDLRERITAVLGDEWRRGRADETIGYLRDSAPRLWPTPPRDRINVANGILDLSRGDWSRTTRTFSRQFRSVRPTTPRRRVRRSTASWPTYWCPSSSPFVHELAGYLTPAYNSLQAAMMLLGEIATGESNPALAPGRAARH